LRWRLGILKDQVRKRRTASRCTFVEELMDERRLARRYVDGAEDSRLFISHDLK
jgi:ribosome biogenesis SPOUT family RNA methylase Rps3